MNFGLARTVFLTAILAAATSPALAKSPGLDNAGRLDAFDKAGNAVGSCPLKHTNVQVEIAGFIARVTVRQEFQNPFKEKIEAIYTFPLSQNAAVDRMTMTVGDRIIEGEIKERQEAQRIYEEARAAGYVASLLDQERPNIFTQSVANIEPGVKVDITISYSETLPWKDGSFQFAFPMVVGPRYVPGQATGPEGTGFAPPTDQVPDAARITPMPTPPETRAGHDLSVTVSLDAGQSLRHLESKQHEVTVEHPDGDKRRAIVKLRDRAAIPNRDFVLEYQTASEQIEDAVLAHTDPRGKFFTLVLQPPKRVRTEEVVPRELIFVIDKSGSMSGFPIETAKRAMQRCIENLGPRDTFNLMTFEGGVGFCFEKPVANTEENRRRAITYLAELQGSGGTEMMAAIHACLAGQDDPERVRVVCFMTDGYVGNDMAIIDAVKKNAGTARVFSFGIGTSVNRFLLDGMAWAGRGEVHYILNEQQSEGAAERFYERIRTPVLTDIQLDFAGVAVEGVYPQQIPDLFSVKPVVVKGRYKQGGDGTITLRGKTGKGPFERKIAVRLPDNEPKNEVLAPLWARAKVEALMNQDLTAIQQNRANPAIAEEILGLGLRYRLLTQFTSFVAVERKRVTAESQAKKVAVPIETPEGVDFEGVFGKSDSKHEAKRQKQGQAIDPFDIGDAPLDPTELTTETLTLKKAPRGPRQKEVYYDDSDTFTERGGGMAVPASGPQLGGLGGFNAIGRSGVAAVGKGGVGIGMGDGQGGVGSGFAGRGSGYRRVTIGAYGGTKQSERTVAGALNWLARRQQKDGSWSFQPGGSTDAVVFPNPGKDTSTAGATALALLPFLGAGQTHESKGPYQQTIYRGVYHLMQHQGKSGNLHAEGEDMVWHAAASLALCETYGMTKDKTAGRAAQKAIKYIAESQDKTTGGWAARPGEKPDLATTAWQLLALESARRSGLEVDPTTRTKASAFLDRFQSDDGAFYGFDGPGKDPRATAMALLCRVHLGWTPGHAALQRGVDYVCGLGPNIDDMVYNHFATQLVFQFQNSAWDTWNRKVRRQLIESQAKEAQESGSWWLPKEAHAAKGGRLFQTTINTLTLEIYYRYLPLLKR